MSREPRRWFDIHPLRLSQELEAMADVAPELEWQEDLPETTGGGWAGLCPIWPFVRPEPPGLAGFLGGRRFRIEARCSPAHPVAEPRIVPVDPEPEIGVRTIHDWHLMGDGSLCLLRGTLDWTGHEHVAELVVKAAGWFLEYLLLDAGLIEAMTVSGIVESTELDHLFVATASEDEAAEG